MADLNTSDSVLGGASGEEAVALQVSPDSMECFPKLSRCLPSIVVEPMEGGEVESGELRWPPDDGSSDITEGYAQVKEASRSWPDEDDGYGEDDVVQVSLSAQSRQVIKQSWREIQDNISRVGVILFVRLFETHPECKDVFFMFRDLDDPEALRTRAESPRTQVTHTHTHVCTHTQVCCRCRIMSVMEKTVARIDQDERLDQLILDLGRKHYSYDASPKHYNFVGVEFIRAVGPVLKERCTTEQEEAWKTLFLYISSTMRRGFQQEQRNQRNQRNQGDVLRRPASVSK